jgi:hypothetical protein
MVPFHVACLLCTSEVNIHGIDLQTNVIDFSGISAAYAKSQTQTCVVCHQKGATVRCAACGPLSSSLVHVGCGLQHDPRFHVPPADYLAWHAARENGKAERAGT